MLEGRVFGNCTITALGPRYTESGAQIAAAFYNVEVDYSGFPRMVTVAVTAQASLGLFDFGSVQFEGEQDQILGGFLFSEVNKRASTGSLPAELELNSAAAKLYLEEKKRRG